MRELTIAAVLLVGAFCFNESEVQSDPEINPYIFEDVINTTLEAIRPYIPDPLLIESFDLNLPDEEGAVITGSLSIANFNLTGLQSYQFTALNFELIGTQLNFSINFPVLDLYTDYDINATVTDSSLNVFGAGSLSVQLDDVTIKASGQANLTGGISLNNLLVQVTLGNAAFDIKGLFNDDELSAAVTEALNESAVQLINENQELVTQIVSPIIEDLINTLLAFIIGSLTTPPPQVTQGFV